MKSYTDLEQSEKLAEILPLESADMHYNNGSCRGVDYTEHFSAELMPYQEALHLMKIHKTNFMFQVIPCWSLAALLQVLPLGIYDEFDNCDYELEIDMIDKMPRYIRLGDIYHSKFPYDFEKDTLLDNIVESIIWLNDNNYFEL